MWWTLPTPTAGSASVNGSSGTSPIVAHVPRTSSSTRCGDRSRPRRTDMAATRAACSRRAASDLADYVRSADTRRALCEYPYPQLAMSDFPQPPAPDQPQSVAQQAPRNGPGIAALILGIIGVPSALVLGIIGVLSGFVPFFFWVAGILGIIGLLLGFIGYGRFQRSEASNGTMALWGIVTSAVAAVVVSIVPLLASL